MGGGAKGLVGKRNLLAGVSWAALTIAGLVPLDALARTYTAGSEAQLNAAITAANADPDPTATIQLTATFVVSSSALIAPSKPITIDTGSFFLAGNTSGGIISLQSGIGSFTLVGKFVGSDRPSATPTSGAGLLLRNSVHVTNNGIIQGGAGLSGTGGNGVTIHLSTAPGITFANNGTVRGGTGTTVGGNGIMVTSTTNSAIVNKGLVEGGNGAEAIRVTSASTNLNLINSGTIRAGAGQANAILLTAGAANGITMELQAGSVIEGNVVGNAAASNDTLRLGGIGSDSFDVSAIGPAAQYRNFDTFEKTGTGTWLLTGVGTTATDWTIYDGTLLIGDHSAASSIIGDITNFGTLGGSGTIFGDVTNSGTVSPGNSIGTLTISGNYIGNGGTLAIESVLAGDASPTDRLVVTGNTSGTTSVKVTNLGGGGAQTVEGIKIVDVGGSSAGTFSLLGDYVFHGDQAVVGGAYAYRLYQNGIATPADGDWYLRSTLLNPDASAGPLYQPGVPLYEAYPQLLLALNGLSTLQQRVGDRYWKDDGKATPQSGPDNIWLRTEGMHASIEPDRATTVDSYDYDMFRLEGGLDGELYQDQAGRLIGGLTVHYGTVSGNIDSLYGNGDIDTTGAGLGATLTWYGDNGFYADAQSQITWFDSDLKSDLVDGAMESGNNGFGYALGIETGRRFSASGPWSITPQAQLVYSSVDFDTFNDRFGARVSLDDGDSLVGRLGVALDREESFQRADGQTARAKIYGIANLYGEFLNGTAVDVSGTGFETKNDPVWAGLTLGGSYNWNDERYSLYGEVAARSSLKDFGDSYAFSGTAGLRVKW